MERKTWRLSVDGYDDVGLRDGVSVGDAICDLAAYEDTGMEPEGIKELSELKTSLTEAEQKMLNDYLGLGSLAHLRELAEADKDGAVGVCPVKLHQHIYRIFNGNVLDEMVCSAMFEPFTPRPRWKVWTMGGGLPYYWDDVIGKTVFLTPSAAKAALEARHAE